MKKAVLLFLFLLSAMILTGCNNEDEEDYLNTVKTELEGIGYVFEQRDEDARTYYNNKAVNEAFELDVTLTDLYIGYVNDTEHWLELLEFESVDEAIEYVDGTVDSGYIVHREGDVVFITYWDGAKAPFIETGTKSGT